MDEPWLAAVRAVVQRVADAVLLCDGRGEIVLANDPALQLLGVPVEAVVGTSIADARWRWAAPGQARAPHGGPTSLRERGPEVVAVTPPGGVPLLLVVEVADVAASGAGAGGQVLLVRLARAPSSPRVEDPPALTELTIDLTRDRATATTAFGTWADLLRTGLVAVDAGGCITGVNAAAVALAGKPSSALVGSRIDGLVAPDDAVAHRPDLRRLLLGELDEHRGTCVVTRADGVLHEVAFRAIAQRDPPEPRAQHLLFEILPDRAALGLPSSDALATVHLGTEDALTGLRGREALLDAIRGRLAQRDRNLAVLHVDLDRFRAVNEVLGHRVADVLLLGIARRLRRGLRPEDALARLEADRFAIVCGALDGVGAAKAAAQRVIAAVAEPIEDAGTRMQLTACVGVAVAGIDDSAEALLSHAEAAARRAKQEGRGRFVVYAGTDRDETVRRARVEAALGIALRQGALRVAYQPVVALADGRIVGAEALARWTDPALGEVAPGVFLPVAEDSGLIDQLSDDVLHHACRTVAAWERASGRPVTVAVNLSPVQLNEARFAAHVEQVLADSAIPASRLCMEITENVVVDATHAAAANLADLHTLGVRLGIDDFGTGYASMSYLKRLPIDFVKVDRSFVAGVGRTREDTAIVRAILALAQSLDVTAVAEGIERQSQAEVLRAMGCDLGQGFLLGRPDSEDHVGAMLAASG